MEEITDDALGASLTFNRLRASWRSAWSWASRPSA